jgi:hypothetical protein
LNIQYVGKEQKGTFVNPKKCILTSKGYSCNSTDSLPKKSKLKKNKNIKRRKKKKKKLKKNSSNNKVIIKEKHSKLTHLQGFVFVTTGLFSSLLPCGRERIPKTALYIISLKQTKKASLSLSLFFSVISIYSF